MNDLKFTTAGDYFNDTNSRIQELAQQAHEYSCAEYTKRLETETADQIFFYKIFNQKFAKLIVEECAGACLHDDWEDPRWGRFYANKIKEHFEVK